MADRRVRVVRAAGPCSRVRAAACRPLPDLLDSVLAGGTLTLCTQCAARRDITEKDVIEGVRIAGAQVFVQEALADGTQALVY